jgi:hypothetical protein
VDGREHWPRMSLEVAGLIFAMAVVGYVECTISHGLSCCNTLWTLHSTFVDFEV